MTQEIQERFDRLERLTVLAAKKVLTINEAALLLGLSKHYLYKLTCKKMIPHYKPGVKLLYFDREELEAWMKRNRVGTASEAEQKAAVHCAKGA